MALVADISSVVSGLITIVGELRSGYAYAKGLTLYKRKGLINPIYEIFNSIIDEVSPGTQSGKLSYKTYRFFFLPKWMRNKYGAPMLDFCCRVNNRESLYAIVERVLTMDVVSIESYLTISNLNKCEQLFKSLSNENEENKDCKAKIIDLSRFYVFLIEFIKYICFRLMYPLSNGEKIIMSLVQKSGMKIDGISDDIAKFFGDTLDRTDVYTRIKEVAQQDVMEKLYAYILFYVYSDAKATLIAKKMLSYGDFIDADSLQDYLKLLALNGTCGRHIGEIFGEVARDLVPEVEKDAIISFMWIIAMCRSFSPEINIADYIISGDGVDVYKVNCDNNGSIRKEHLHKFIDSCINVSQLDAMISPHLNKRFEGIKSDRYYMQVPETGTSINDDLKARVAEAIMGQTSKYINEYKQDSTTLDSLLDETNARLGEYSRYSGLPAYCICIFNSQENAVKLAEGLKPIFPMLKYVVRADDGSFLCISSIETWNRSVDSINTA